MDPDGGHGLVPEQLAGASRLRHAQRTRLAPLASARPAPYDAGAMDEPSDDRTKTNRQQRARAASAVRRWALHMLYMGSTGITHGAPLRWDGRTPLTIGRRTAVPRDGGPWLPLDDEQVSREHAQIFRSGDAACIKDCDSKNGTHVNAKRLRPGEAWELASGDLIEVGGSLILARYEIVESEDRDVVQLRGPSAALRRLRCSLAHYAATLQPVLLLGETGTGKGAAAQALHQLSGRRGKLVPINCAAIPATLAESLFFGVQRGAFTEAVEHAGFFGEAHQGTLFLDEVGDLPLALQPKLLQALETRQVTPLGSARPISWDVRIVAATNRDLERSIREQTFRSDLYGRLAAVVLTLPPVRERREDVLPLAQHLAGGAFHPSLRLAAALVRYDWPRNVRELGHLVSQIPTEGEEAIASWLEARSPGETTPAAGAGQDSSRSRVVWKAGDPPPTKRQLETLFAEYRGNLLRIETETGLSRRQLHRWAEKYGLDIDTYRRPSTKDTDS